MVSDYQATYKLMMKMGVWGEYNKNGWENLIDSGQQPSCPHPGCPVVPTPFPSEQCTANKPLLLYIPPGQHHHLPCPIHGEHILYGPNVTY